jgi:hypothetical protein
MKKIAEINRETAKPLHAWFIGVVATILTGIVLSFIYPFSFMNYLERSHLIEILMTVPTILFVFLVHEWIHVFFFILFGKGKAKIKVKRERKIGAVIMHQVNEEVFYSRIQMIIILLAPLVFLTILLAGLMCWIGLPYLFYVNILLNVLGSSVDLYLTFRLLLYKSPIWVNFSEDKLNMNIYQR